MRPERRKERRDVPVDRRKSIIDVFERVGDGVHPEHVPPKRRGSAARRSRKK
jgi:hypothetical protein